MGTPHKPTPEHGWPYLLTNLFYEQSHGLPGPWMPHHIQTLTNLHQILGERFYTVLQGITTPLEVVSFCQEQPKADEYKVVSLGVETVMFPGFLL